MSASDCCDGTDEYNSGSICENTCRWVGSSGVSRVPWRLAKLYLEVRLLPCLCRVRPPNLQSQHLGGRFIFILCVCVRDRVYATHIHVYYTDQKRVCVIPWSWSYKSNSGPLEEVSSVPSLFFRDRLSLSLSSQPNLKCLLPLPPGC